MASPQLKQLEHELEVAAVQLSMADQPLSHLSDADHMQSALVSEARVVDAAKRALATDPGAPIERMLSDSAQHPLFVSSDRERWHRFLVEVAQQLRVEKYVGRPQEALSTPRFGERVGWIHRWRQAWISGERWLPGPRVGIGALVFSGLVVGALFLTGGRWSPLGDGGCTGEDCSGGFQAMASQQSTTPLTAGTTTLLSDGFELTPSSPMDENEGRGWVTSETSSLAPADADTAATPSVDTETTAVSTSTTASTAPLLTTTSAVASTSSPTAAPTTETTVVSTTTTVAPDATTTTMPPASRGVACPIGSSTLTHDVTGVASDDVLNVRLGPGVSFDPIYGLAYDASAEIFDQKRSGGWVMVVVPGAAAPDNCGWSYSSFLTAPGP
ncbi:MAG: hypothetical protein GY724_30480 [Actinomycetia bacterium]|nr:hypothetical protein [Actinomycetes bacterium]